MKKMLTLLAAVALLSACANKTEDLKTQVMAVHDEMMPVHNRLHKMAAQLKQAEDSLKTSPGVAALSQVHLALLEVSSGIQAMDAWMADFDIEKAEAEGGEAYLQDQLKQVTLMKQLMERGEKAAETQLTALGRPVPADPRAKAPAADHSGHEGHSH